MKINIRLTESEAELLKKKKEQTGKNTTEIFKSAIYFTGVDETFVDNLISNIGVLASNNDIEGIKEEVQRYVASGTPNRTPPYPRISESDRASAIPGER